MGNDNPFDSPSLVENDSKLRKREKEKFSFIPSHNRTRYFTKMNILSNNNTKRGENDTGIYRSGYSRRNRFVKFSTIRIGKEPTVGIIRLRTSF